MLGGITMGILRRQLDRFGVPQRDKEVTLADLPANSWTPGIAVHRIGAVPVPPASEFVELLHRAYEAEPLLSL